MHGEYNMKKCCLMFLIHNTFGQISVTVRLLTYKDPEATDH
jgi:hypothetical protein